jgi:hypothetical protein
MEAVAVLGAMQAQGRASRCGDSGGRSVLRPVLYSGRGE